MSMQATAFHVHHFGAIFSPESNKSFTHTAFMDRDEIDHILRRKRKPTEKACYPCHRRKVRCNHAHPCSTCQKRGHPEICSYSFSATKRRDRRRRPDVDNSLQGITVAHDSASSRQDNYHEAVDDSLLDPPLEPSGDQSSADNSGNLENGEVCTPTYQGDNSIVSMLRQRATDLSPSSRIRDARVFFGLQNSSSSDPLFTVPATQQRWETLVSLLPQKQEFHR